MPRGRPSRVAIHARLDAEVAELRARLGGLPSPEEAEGIWTDIWHQEAHHSTALEGNTLVRRQVEVLLKEGRAIGDKELREYLEVRGYADAARWVYGRALEPGDWETGSLVSMAEVRHAHELIVGPAWNASAPSGATEQEGPGHWRKHDIEPFWRGMQPPSWTEVHAQMSDWLTEVDALRAPPLVPVVTRKGEVVVTNDGETVVGPDHTPIGEIVARLHAAFERIHPFYDGNGRTGRLLTNLMLVRLGYPPVIIQKRERSSYLTALDRADRGDPGPLGELFARAILDNLNRFIVPAVAGPNRMVPLEALATPTIKVTALRRAAERGRLRARRGENGRWRSSKAWLDEYLANRWGRGARPARPPIGSAAT